jgi:hypothetical protein
VLDNFPIFENDGDADTYLLQEYFVIAMAEQISYETGVRDAAAVLHRKLEKEYNIQLDDIRGE